MSETHRGHRMATCAMLLAAVAVVWLLGGCNSQSDLSVQGKKYEAASDEGETASQPASGVAQQPAPQTDDRPPANKPPVRPADTLGPSHQADPLKIPDGAPEEILAFVQQLETKQPQGRTREEMFEQYKRIQRARIEGCDRILTGKASDEVRMTAVQTKVDALRVLNELADPEAHGQLAQFARSLQSDENADIARFGRLLTFGFHVDEYVSGKTKDFAALEAELTELLKDKGAHPHLVDLGQQVASVLYGMGQKDKAGRVMQLIGQQLKGDGQLAEAAESMLLQAKMINLDFEGKMNAALDSKPNAVGELISTIRQLAGDGPPSQTIYEVTQKAGRNLETGGNYEGAAELYRLLASMYKGHSDAGLAEAAARQAEHGLRRVGLVGKPFELSGVTLDGQPLDWSQYRGKVVLVDFWATWCTPCLAEIPNIEKNYKAYHDKGFEVIGVNLDDDRQKLEAFLAQRKLLWKTVVSADPKAQGFDNPVAVQCGVDAIPFLVLVDQKGVAVALHVRGDELGQQLERLLGPVEAGAGQAPSGATRPAGTTGQAEPPAPAAGTSASAARELLTGEPLFFVAITGEEAAQQPPADASTAKPLPDVNPYLAPAELTPQQLVDYILDMQQKPRSIQERPDFAAALIEAADRILAAAGARPAHRRLAALTKLSLLHKKASEGDAGADKQLRKAVEQLAGETDRRVAAEIEFLKLEREAIDGQQLPLEKIPELLERLKAFYQSHELTDRHLRMASHTVKLINRLDSDDEKEKEQYADQREKYFAQFGQLFARSDSKKLARYGRQLAGPSAERIELVGKKLQLEGLTALGTQLNWNAYRGKVVLVDFWATWCGPCRRAMPQLLAFYQKHKERGFEVLGVNLDEDSDQLARFLEQNELPWENLVGEQTQKLAEKLGIHALPTLLLVDRQGTVVAVGHKLDELTEQVEKQLDG